jgi:biopolymer transport protein ExbB
VLEEKMLDFALLGAGWVLWLLVILSVLCVGIAVERGIYLALNTAPSSKFEQVLGAFLGGGTRSDLERGLGELRGLEVRVLQAGLAAARNAPDAAEAAMAGTLSFEKLRAERGLLVIGTVASNAPFIGLFGTVLGIIKAFRDLSLDNAEGAGAVMAGISEALVATAVGLLVAIPAVVLFNALSRKVKSTCARVESLGQLVLSRLHAEAA